MIRIRNIVKMFGAQKIIDGIELDIKPATLVTLLGPSGCGKTTLLRIIAGLESPDEGSILFDGINTSHWSIKERNVGFVFQNYALFQHMTVAENISFGLRMRPRGLRPTSHQIAERVKELLHLIQLEGLGQRFPHQLSGGQSQRVALARALAVEPRLLLLDEPFGALDAKVRKDLRAWLRDLQKQLQLTCILVTHDQEEALEISDHVVLLNQGRIEQEGAPGTLFDSPSTLFGLTFLGNVQSLEGHEFSAGRNLFVRPHELRVEKFAEDSEGNHATIRSVSVRGATARLQLTTGAGLHRELTAELGREYVDSLGLKAGDQVTWSARRTHAFDG